MFALLNPEAGSLFTDTRVRLDPKAVAAVFADHDAALRAMLMGLLRDSGEVQDAMQATFVKALEFGHTAAEESLKGWIFKVACREALVLRRRRGVRDRSLVKLAALLHRESEAPEAHLLRQDIRTRVHQALEGLSPDQQLVVKKKIFDSQTFDAIAQELGVPLGTVATRMRTAMQILRRVLRSLE